MDSSDQEVAQELLPLLRVYKNGRVERLMDSKLVPPSLDDPETHVSSKDVVLSPESGVSARLYLPKLNDQDVNNKKKLPLLINFHGGAFCIESAFSVLGHRYLNFIVSHANVIAVSVEYRQAPEHPLPVAFDDCWTAINWVATQMEGGGAEPWLTNHADLGRVFVGGDSAGATIAHNVAMRAGKQGLPNGLKIFGAVLVQPYFWGSEPIGSEIEADPAIRVMPEKIWRFVAPNSSGIDDPMINPVVEGAPSLAELGCSRVLISVAGKDLLRERGKLYWEGLKKSGWKGESEFFEVEGKDHAFHFFSPESEDAVGLIKRIASFLNYK